MDTQYGWTIKKEKQKPSTIIQLQHRCTAKDKDGRDCTEFFADKEKWDEHVAESCCSSFFIVVGVRMVAVEVGVVIVFAKAAVVVTS